jgi:hypothetical protein
MIAKVLSKHSNLDYTELFKFPNILIFLEKLDFPEEYLLMEFEILVKLI